MGQLSTSAAKCFNSNNPVMIVLAVKELVASHPIQVAEKVERLVGYQVTVGVSKEALDLYARSIVPTKDYYEQLKVGQQEGMVFTETAMKKFLAH